jgi:hypothetical protein
MLDGRSVSQHLFAGRRIGTKIGAGFVAVLAILAISSVAAWLAFGRVSAAVGRYAELVAVSDIYRSIDKTVAQYRGHVREYIFSDNESLADSAVKEGGTVRELITSGLARVTNPERHSLLESMTRQAETYASNFAHVRELNTEQAKLETGVMDVAGQQMTDGFSTSPRPRTRPATWTWYFRPPMRAVSRCLHGWTRTSASGAMTRLRPSPRTRTWTSCGAPCNRSTPRQRVAI